MATQVDLLLSSLSIFRQVADHLQDAEKDSDLGKFFGHVNAYGVILIDCLSPLGRNQSRPSDLDSLFYLLLKKLTTFFRRSLSPEYESNLPSSNPFRRLETLIHYWSATADNGKKLGWTRQCLDFSCHEQRAEMILMLRGCVATLQTLHYDEPGVVERRTRAKKGKRPLSIYTCAKTVFDALAVSSRACSAVHNHDCAARLRLSTYQKQGEDRHDFEALITLNLTCHVWQEARIQAIISSLQPAKKTTVKFVVPETNIEKSQHRRYRRLAVVRLCEQIEKLKSKPMMRLNLAVENGKLWKDQSSRIERPINQSDSQISLADIIKQRPASMTEKVKRVLAVLLAYTVLHLHATPWLRPSSFNADNILFFGTSATIPLKPYIHSALSESYIEAPQSDTDELDPDDLPSHPFPDIVMLAILLMELYLIQPIRSLAEQVGMEFEEWEAVDDNTRYSIAIAVYERFQTDFPDNYRQAVDRCLSPDIGFDENDEELSSDDLKMLIYDEIVQPLEDELDQGFGNTIQIEKLDDIAQTMDLSRWGQMRQPNPESLSKSAELSTLVQTAPMTEGSISIARTSTFWSSSERLVSNIDTCSSHQDYTVGWICALPKELAAAQALLDELHPPLPQDSSDLNNYTLGRMGAHNVVMACLPSGVMGTVSAARVANNMRSTFRCLRFGLMVGIGGGVPGAEDVRLGDVVVGEPNGPFGGVIQYDFGKTVQNGEFLRTGSLNRPSDLLLTAISRLKADHYRNGADLSQHLIGMFDKYPHLSPEFSHPGSEHDVLYKSDYGHCAKPGSSCQSCDSSKLIGRTPRSSQSPQIHYGLIASGNQVMRDGRTREKLRNDLNVLCFEMEAAGIVDVFPSLVIRGICDYSDSHKTKIWQGYAAATAAAYAKELLSVISGSQIDNAERLGSFQS